MKTFLNRIIKYIRNIFLDEVDKPYQPPEVTLRDKIRDNRNPVKRLKKRHKEFQDFNKFR